MNMENNAFNQPPNPPQPPQSDPQVDQLARELETSWIHYQSLRRAAGVLKERPYMPEELIAALKDTAKKQLDTDIAQSVRRFIGQPLPPPGGSTSGPQSQPNAQTDRTNPKKLCRTEYDKMLAGVCGGVGEYLNVDSSIVRLAFVIASFAYLSGLIAYIVLAILLPLKLTPQEEC